MRFAASITDEFDMDQALRSLLAPIDSRITPGMVDLALLFVNGHFKNDLPEIVEKLHQTFPSAIMLGCTAEGTIGVDREVERVPSLSLLVGSLPDVEIRPFYLQQKQLTTTTNPLDWERHVGVSPESHPTFIALADPFRFGVLDFIESVNQAYPGAPMVGGLASAARSPGENRLTIGGDIYDEGLVGVALTGRLKVDTVVSQGCRPIGKSFVTTKAEQNVIHELGGQPALKQLHEVLVNLPPAEEKLARQSLFLGRVIDEYKDRFTRGDFLIHNIIGADRESGSLAVAGPAKVGATVQFHVRDAKSADEDLREMLTPYKNQDIRGALLFGCNGRGTKMWTDPDHDIGALRESLGDVPTAGFFCGGEFGPVGGKNFVHGFTASIALFRQPTEPVVDDTSRIG